MAALAVAMLVRHQDRFARLREQELVPVTIRQVVAASSNVWKVSLLKNLSAFDGKFYQPLPE